MLGTGVDGVWRRLGYGMGVCGFGWGEERHTGHVHRGGMGLGGYRC